MYCLTNMCYVCLEKNDKSLININSSLSVNKDIIHIIGYLPFNLGWLKTKRIILICEECCRRLRETYHLLAMCLKNSAVLQGYMDQLNPASAADAEAELRVDLHNEPDGIIEIKCEIKLEEEEVYTVEPVIEETNVVFVNCVDGFVKKEYIWNMEEVDGTVDPPMESNGTESGDNGSDWVNANTHDTDTGSDSSGFTSAQGHTTNPEELNTAAKKAYKCSTCSKSFTRKTHLQIHRRVHKGGRQYKCSTCAKCFRDNFDLMRHERTHTGEKPYECSVCQKRFTVSGRLVAHMRVHTGEKAYKCHVCAKRFRHSKDLASHRLLHTGERPFKCSRCDKSFQHKTSLAYHSKKCAVHC